eukprot:TRINITY_DN6084_c0_g2_i3.p8 TRINITY_DN6084_c0_g2~~TRINITY_DN6084_c0_g2_i3.p8  ORF type:complete len:106 (+),score=2.49 TRINITY_DN6084_c0_g2_i3:194-511(+)
MESKQQASKYACMHEIFVLRIVRKFELELCSLAFQNSLVWVLKMFRISRALLYCIGYLVVIILGQESQFLWNVNLIQCIKLFLYMYLCKVWTWLNCIFYNMCTHV